MIAKRVLRPRTKDSFGRLGLYILGKKVEAGAAPAAMAGESWQRTAAYVLDLPGGGGRVGAIRISNCAAAEPADAIAEIQAVQALNTRARGDKTYHLVVSFPPGERPSEAQLHEIEDELCAAIGLGDHQRISAVHTDTDHLHIHVAINKVHPVTRRSVEPWYDKRKLMSACDRLEIRHGLQRTNHQERDKDMLRGRGADMEAHAGQEALARWIREHALDDIQSCLRNGAGWDDLHRVLARYDLTIKPRGAGLALVTVDGALGVRASRFSRALSLAALTKRWGAYRPPTGLRPAAQMRYERQPKRKSLRSGRLWDQYQRQREAPKAARDAGFAHLQAETEWRRKNNAYWSRSEYDSIDTAAFGPAGKAVLRIRHQTAVYRQERKLAEWRWAQREAISQANPMPTWFGFLQAKAGDGDVEALAILREQEARHFKEAQAFAAAPGEAAAHDVVFSALRPAARKNGDMVYRLRDGGRVIDRTAGILVEVTTPHALFLTLSLQAERCPDRAVTLGGNAQFQAQMVEMAAAKAMNLTFADRNLECRRCTLMGLPLPPEPPPPPARTMLGRIGRMLTGSVKARRT